MSSRIRPLLVSALPMSFDASGDIEWDGFHGLLDLVAPWIDAALVSGTTGEFLAMSDDERVEATKRAIEVLGGHRVIAHLGHGSAHQALRLGRRLMAVGATRFATISPLFMASDSSTVLRFYEEVTDGLSGVEHFIYLFPERTGATVTPVDMARLSGLDGIAGVKLSGSANSTRREHLSALQPGQLLLSGQDGELPEIVSEGGHGVVSGVSSAFPEALSALCDEIADGTAEVTSSELVRTLVAAAGVSIPALKLALSTRVPGTWSSRMAMPTPTSSQRAAITTALRRAGIN